MVFLPLGFNSSYIFVIYFDYTIKGLETWFCVQRKLEIL